jgi:hypothetical protein
VSGSLHCNGAVELRAEIFSAGTVTAIDTVIWGPGDGPINKAKGISFDLWSQPGDSGSSILSGWTNRIIAGPTSTGQTDAPGRNALSIKTEMEEASVDGWFDGNSNSWKTGIHDTEIKTLGLNPSSYSGRIDKNGDYRFDIQADLERQRGENARVAYNLGFDSPRTNGLWDVDGMFTTFSSSGTATINVTVPSLFGGWDLLVHRRVPLLANRRYQAHFNSFMSDWGMKLVVRGANGGPVQTSYDIPWSPDWFDNIVELAPIAGNVEVAIIGATVMSGALRDFYIIEEEQPLGFDTADERHMFYDPSAGNAGVPARFSLDGEPNGRNGWSFAADVDVRTSVTGTSYSVATRKLPLRAGTEYELCFDVRRNRPGADPRAVGSMEVRDQQSRITGVTFQPSDTWTTLCTESFHADSETGLQFGVSLPGASSYFVDNVVVTRQACGTTNLESGPAYDECVNGSCVCTPSPDPCGAQTDDPVECGLVSNGCGGTLSCGTCRGSVCANGHCERRPHCPPGQICDN